MYVCVLAVNDATFGAALAHQRIVLCEERVEGAHLAHDQRLHCRELQLKVEQRRRSVPWHAGRAVIVRVLSMLEGRIVW